MLKYLEKKGKRFFFKLAKATLRNRLKRKEEIDFSTIKKILVVRQDKRIGNLVLTTPFLFSLKEFFPKAEVFYLASKTFSDFFSGHFDPERILTVDKRRFIVNPLSFLKLLRKIRHQNFDLCFDLSDENQISATNLLYTYLSGAEYKVGHKREGSEAFLNIEVPKERKPKHAADMHLDLLRFLFGEVRSLDLNIDLSVESGKNALDYLEDKGINEGDFLVGINLGGREKKRWDKRNFLEVANFLVERFNCKVILIWGPEEKALVKHLKLERNIVLADLLPLPTLAALIKRCDLFVSSDSGVMHLSTAVKTPTFAIFLDSDPVKYGPRGSKHRIIVGKDGKVSVEKVKEKLQGFLKSMFKREHSSVKRESEFSVKSSPGHSPYEGEGRGRGKS